MIKNITSHCYKILLLIVCLIVGCSLCSFQITASAAEFEGKGTKNSPYIVSTPQQLDAIRNSLKSYYKLGATIDMKDFGNFKSIGTGNAPFTGSFICDTDEKGVPLYAITNLTIHFEDSGATKSGGFSGYKDDGSMGWQIGLFGNAEGSKYENIIILNADVSSNVEGLYGMNSDWSINPTKFQSTGVLLGSGTDVSISGCGVTGKLSSSSNYTGGMVGSIKGSIKNSYSYVEVISTGTWVSGGLAGSASKLEGCFYRGTFSGGVTHAGALVGELPKDDGIVVKNCWVAGTVKTESSGCFGGVDNHGGGTIPNAVEVSENCYTLAKIEGRTKAQTTKRVTNNNYITNEVGGYEYGFAAADMATINSAFKELEAWVVNDGNYPQLKNTNSITDITQLGKAKAATQNNASVTSQTEVTSQISETGQQSEVETSAVQSYTLKTNFNKTIASLNKTDKIWISVTAGIVLLTLAGSVVTVILALKHGKSQKSIKTIKKEL